MKCPFCGKEMANGVIFGDPRMKVRWRNQDEKLDMVDVVFVDKGHLPAKYTLTKFEMPGDYCTECGKIILDVKEEKKP